MLEKNLAILKRIAAKKPEKVVRVMQKVSEQTKPIPFKLRMWGWPPLRMVEDPQTVSVKNRPARKLNDPFRNPRKQAILKFAFAVFFTMALIPPWKESVSSTGVRFEKDRGYNLVFLSPKPQYRFGTVALDFERLGMQAGVAGLVVMGALALTRKEIQEQPLIPFTESN